jgi:hypothetical protein
MGDGNIYDTGASSMPSSMKRPRGKTSGKTLALIRAKAVQAKMVSQSFSDSPHYNDGNAGAPPMTSPSPLSIQSGQPGGTNKTQRTLAETKAGYLGPGNKSKQDGPSPSYTGGPGSNGQAAK